MKKAGLTLITLSFLVGAYLTVLDQQEVDWAYFVPAVIVGFIGVGLVQMGKKQEASATETLTENIAVLEESIDNIVTKVAKLNAEKEETDTYDVHGLIDSVVLDDLNNFIAARETIGHVYGLQAYADVMNHYAGGERYLNRVWSASADGYIDEVHLYLGKAEEQFIEARDKLHALKAG